jgi:hypothetical protein
LDIEAILPEFLISLDDSCLVPKFLNELARLSLPATNICSDDGLAKWVVIPAQCHWPDPFNCHGFGRPKEIAMGRAQRSINDLEVGDISVRRIDEVNEAVHHTEPLVPAPVHRESIGIFPPIGLVWVDYKLFAFCAN